MSARRPKLVVDHNPDGWPLDHGQSSWVNPYNPGRKLCGTQLLGVCTGLPVWRTQRRGRGYISTGYYCDEHLNADARASHWLRRT